MAPIQKLKELPEGDGAFLAISAGLFLCERYYRTVTGTHEGQGDSRRFREAAAEDLGIPMIEFEIFWQVFRHGIQHQGMPKIYHDNDGVEYRWNIGDAYQALPLFITPNGSTNLRVILINPWAFVELVCQRYRTNPSILDKATSHAFGQSFG